MRRGWLVIAVAAMLPLSAEARADGLFLGGSEYSSESAYGYLGAIMPLPENHLGSGFAVRVWGDYLKYRYTSGGTKIEASGWGAAVAAVYQFSGSWGWSNFSAGGEFRDLELSPDDPANDSRGSHLRLTVQGDGGYNLRSDWRVRGTASYTPEIEGYFVQPAIEHKVAPRLWLGLDGTFQGDNSYEERAGGVIATFNADEQRSVSLRLGGKNTDDGTNFYVGLSFVISTH